MSDDRTRPLSKDELAAVLKRLDEVMLEAEELRRVVTRQMAEQRSGTRQAFTPAAPTHRKRRR
jgi:hypothetical protein